jgi:hypothetical protein
MPDQWAIAATLARGTAGSAVAIVSPRDVASGKSTGKLFAPTRVGSMQSLRFLVANLGTTTASFDVDVVNAAGVVVAEATIADVAAGTIGYHSFPSVGQGVRRAVVTGPGDAIFTLSEEVFDTATGRLDAYIPVCGCNAS